MRDDPRSVRRYAEHDARLHLGLDPGAILGSIPAAANSANHRSPPLVGQAVPGAGSRRAESPRERRAGLHASTDSRLPAWIGQSVQDPLAAPGGPPAWNGVLRADWYRARR